MNAMAAAGLGADGPRFETQSLEFAFAATGDEDEEEKCDYKADNESEAEDEGAARGQEEDGVKEDKEIKQELDALATTRPKDVGSLYSLDVEEQTLIQDTTVVQTYVGSVLEEERVAVTSAVTFNRAIDLTEDTESHESMEETQEATLELSQPATESIPYGEKDKEMRGNDKDLPKYEVQGSGKEGSGKETPETEVDAAVDSPSDTTVDESKSAEGKSESSTGSATSGKDHETKATAMTNVDLIDKTQSLSSEEETLKEIKQEPKNANDSSPAAVVPSTRLRHSKRVASASSKKRKEAPTSPYSPHLRRSPRVKQKVSNSSSSANPLAGDALMAHFDRVDGTHASSPATPTIRCKYCGEELTMSRGSAARHWKQCTGSRGEGDYKEDKAPAPSSVPAIKIESLSNEQGSSLSLVELLGTAKLAGQVKVAFQHAAFAGDAPLSRFQELIRDNVTGLRHLNVYHLLDSVNELDGPILQLHVKRPGVQRTTGQDQVDSVSKAKARCLERCSLRFPAPRKVAKHFIAPLAKELGLEYAMEQHSATITSCQLEGSVLDWRFHRNETVVFQLVGNSVWRTKMCQVEYPRRCFHPDSWSLKDMVPLVKVHQLATLEKEKVGFLDTPDDDLGVFDDRGDGELSTFSLKPGSVAYFPAGAWFDVETTRPNALWIELQLVSWTYEDFAFSALRQLAWGDKRWRKGVQLYCGNRSQVGATRNHMENCMKALQKDMLKLGGGDILPEYLGTEDLNDLIARGLIQELNISPRSKTLEVDLTNPKFKLKHEKVFRDATYRVNPVALLMTGGEIPHLEEVNVTDTRDLNVESSHRALKKTPKPQRKQKSTALQSGKSTYWLEERFGNGDFASQVQVKFQCSLEQAKLVEWLRSRGAAPFDLNDLMDVGPKWDSARCEENARNLLRFLRFVGYVTQVKAP